MAKRLPQNHQKLLKFLELLALNPQFLTVFEAEPTSPTTWEYIKAAALEAKLERPPSRFEAFLRIVSQNAASLPSHRLCIAVNNYQQMVKTGSNTMRLKKRELVSALNLGNDPLSYAELANLGKVIIVHRDRMPDKYRRGTVLVDRGNEDLVPVGKQFLAVPPDDTWYVVREHESIIFVNSTNDVELAIIRGCCILRPDLIDHVNEVIADAVCNRRGVRPNHGGKLIQYGWNAGPRHARIFGLVRNNFNKKLSGEQLGAQDKSILGIMSLTWNFLTAVLPKEVIDSVREKVDEAGLPPMTSPGNMEESGFELSLPEGTLTWTTAERAPAEAYMSQDYTAPIHVDQLYAPYALNWVTMHDVVDSTTAGLTRKKKRVKFQHTSGGNYVDVSLGVVVKCTRDTAMAMRPNFKHGTTLSRPGVKRGGTAINFATHIKVAFDKATEAGGLVVDNGANSA